MGAISLKSCCLSAAASAVRAPGAPGRRDSDDDDDDEDDEDAAATATKGLSAKGLEVSVVRRRLGKEAGQFVGAVRSERGRAIGDMAFKKRMEKRRNETEAERKRERRTTPRKKK